MRTLQEQLTEKGLSEAHTQEKSNLNAQTSKRPKEQLSRKEIEELMGLNRETYYKQGGAYRRRR